MTKQNIYKYFGRNGVIVSLVYLDYSNRLDMYQLIADPGKVLTNGERFVQNVIINPDELDQWSEQLQEADIKE